MVIHVIKREGKDVANIYLLKCSSYNVINEEIAALTEGYTIATHSLNEQTIDECLEDASYFGMFDSKRAFVIKDTKYFGGKFAYENEVNTLLNFLKNIDDDTRMIFICDDIKKTKDATKKVIALGAEIKDIPDYKGDILEEKIREYAHKNAFEIKSDALTLLLKNCLDNYDIILQELNKMSLVDKVITKDIVNTYGLKVDGDYTFDFSNAVIAKDFAASFDYLDKLLADGVEVVALIAVLASSFSNMYMVKMAVNDGLSDEEIQKLFGYSSTGRVYVLKKNAKIYTLDQLREIIIGLEELDKKIKTGDNPVYRFKEFLLSL